MAKKRSFPGILRRFKEQVNALDDLARTVTPHLDELQRSPAWGEKVSHALRPLDESRRDIVVEIVPLLPEMWKALLTGSVEEAQECIERINSFTPDFTIIHQDGRLEFATDDSELAKPIMEAMDGIQKDFSTPPHLVLLRRSILTMAVSAFEVYMGELLRQHLRMHTGALNSEVKEFSLTELLTFDSMDDAVESLISREVEQFTRRGVDEWEKWFKGPALKLSMQEAAADWPDTKEVFERRNLVIHRDCKVSPQYLTKVPKSIRGDLSLDDHLDVSEEYLSRAIELLLQLGLSLGLRMWAKFNKSNEEPADWIVDEQLEFLERGRASVTLHLGKTFVLEGIPGATALPMSVNSWIAQKELGGLGAIRQEVDDWDTGQLALIYQVAKSSLLEDHAAAETGVRKLIDRDELDIVHLRYWPLFRPLRESGCVDDLLTPVAAEAQMALSIKLEPEEVESAPGDAEEDGNSEDGADSEPTHGEGD